MASLRRMDVMKKWFKKHKQMFILIIVVLLVIALGLAPIVSFFM